MILDEAYFEKIFREHFKDLCYYAINFVKDYETAREITQEAFIALWDKRSSIETSLPVKAYLKTSVYHKSLNYLRDNKKFNHDLLNAEGRMNIVDESGDKMVFKEVEKAVMAAIAQLPEKCREAFTLNRFEGKKYQEVAEAMNISVKTVEIHISKALQHLREKLGEFLFLAAMLLHLI
jgi:RNA polymerase sigma-70 factor (ECF subfamily)